ncbi:radical SAM protein [bacterium]|nr:radical SAM protein [bacterium]
MKRKHIFGPVPSRRLGLSLGVDIIPFKTCPYSCIYCQIGKTPQTTVERREYVKTESILSELARVILSGVKADYVTFSGSGEPTLHSNLGYLIQKAKEISNIPVAVITNGALLNNPDVRRDLLNADLVVPSLDAACEETFKKINLSHKSIDFNKIIDGLISFSKEYKGKLWLEILFVKDVNDSDGEIIMFKNIIDKLRVDKIHLNTVVRPPADGSVQPVSQMVLKKIATIFGPKSEIVAPFNREGLSREHEGTLSDIEDMLSRRPCTSEDILASLNIHPLEVERFLEILCEEGVVEEVNVGDEVFYKLVNL